MSKLNNKETKKQIKFLKKSNGITDAIKAILFQFLPLSHQKAR